MQTIFVMVKCELGETYKVADQAAQSIEVVQRDDRDGSAQSAPSSTNDHQVLTV